MPIVNDEPGTRWRRPGFVRPSTGVLVRAVFSSIWLVYLIQAVADLFSHHGGHRHGALYVAGGLVIAVIFCVGYVPLVISAFASRPRWALGTLAFITVLAGLACTVYGSDWTELWLFVSAATGLVLAGAASSSTAARGVLAVAACYAFFSWLSHAGVSEFLALLLPVVLLGFGMIGMLLQSELTRELIQARETVAQLAANEERLRLARDMHDLTGQSLSLITLKSEVAARRLARLPHSPEHDAIAAELAGISQVSRQTLQDIREAVSGYRRPTLAVELITARTALDAAGLTFDEDPALITRSGTLDPEAEAVLAWCLREAVTNVIRHSGASGGEIRLGEHNGELSLTVVDNGRGAAGTGTSTSTDAGTGLRGMSERLAAAGGRLELTPVAPHGFRVTATVPATVTATVPATAAAAPAPAPATITARAATR